MLHLVHILEATTGGTRRHLRDLLFGLDPARFRQSLIASPLRDPGFLDDVELFRRRGVDVHLVPMQRAPSPLSDARAVLRVAGILRRLRPAIVHTHSSKAGMLGRWAAWRTGVPLRFHSPHVFAFEMRASKLQRAVYLQAERLAARWTSALVCVSEAEARTARQLGARLPLLRVIHNGVEPGSEDPAPLFAGARPKVALLGRFCEQKGQDTLVSALESAPDLAHRCSLELVGLEASLPLSSRIRAAAESGLCRLVPALPPEEVSAYWRTVDVLVMPSRWEGLPYTLLEGMAAGRCVLATAVGGVPEVVSDGIDGRLVPPDDPGALAAALREILDDPPQAREWGRQARKTVLRRFRRDTMLETLSLWYEETFECQARSST